MNDNNNVQQLLSLMFNVRKCLMKCPEFKKIVVEKDLMYIRTKNGKTLNLYNNYNNDDDDDIKDDNDDDNEDDDNDNNNDDDDDDNDDDNDDDYNNNNLILRYSKDLSDCINAIPDLIQQPYEKFEKRRKLHVYIWQRQ